MWGVPYMLTEQEGGRSFLVFPHLTPNERPPLFMYVAASACASEPSQCIYIAGITGTVILFSCSLSTSGT